MKENDALQFVTIESDEEIVGVFIRDITSVICSKNDFGGNYMKVYLQDGEFYDLKFESRSKCKKQYAQLAESINRIYGAYRPDSISYSSGGVSFSGGGYDRSAGG